MAVVPICNSTDLMPVETLDKFYGKIVSYVQIFDVPENI